MISKYLPSMWGAIAAGIGDHLWQSTLFAVVAALLTLTLRGNQARTRYWLWLAASVKFLIPFSLLVWIGNHLPWASTSSTGTSDVVYVTVEELSRPFTQAGAPAIGKVAPSLALSSPMHMVASILAVAWLCGFVTVILVWCVRWKRIAAALRSAVPLREGREVEALRRVEKAAQIGTNVELLLSRTSLEPGIFGLRRPVLVWPEGISERLENDHLEAILAHELWHVRRLDNLAAVQHMVVEAIFWFHPLVWWLGARLLDERERACDEQVLESGSQRSVYAESILKVCEFCVEAPLPCVSGVTGADLKKRMVHIMSENVARKLNFVKKLLLSSAAIVAIALPVGFGLMHATPSRAQSQGDAVADSAILESAPIKPSELSTPTYSGGKVHMARMMYGPDGFFAANVSLKTLIQEAYGVQANQIFGGPDWLDSAAYDVRLKTRNVGIKVDLEANATENRRLLQSLLADRAKLVLHHESKELPSYALVVAPGGSKLQAPTSDMVYAEGMKDASGRPMGAHQMMMRMGEGKVVGIEARGVATEDLARQLSMQLGITVVDKTGLKGPFNFELHWSSEATQPSKGTDGSQASDNVAPEASAPSLFTAIEQQLGLKLKAQEAPLDVVVIDHVEKPAEN